MSNEKDFFDKFGLEVVSGDIEVGQTYPIYGMITKIIDDRVGSVVVEINYNIQANLQIPDEEKIQLIKERAFEPGIFVSTVTSKDPKVIVEVVTVVFGRKQTSQVQ